MWLILLLWWYVVVNLADGFLTYYGITHRGFGEGNEILIAFAQKFGLISAIIIIKAPAIIFGAVLSQIYQMKIPVIFRCICLAILIYLAYVTSMDSLEWAKVLFWSGGS